MRRQYDTFSPRCSQAADRWIKKMFTFFISYDLTEICSEGTRIYECMQERSSLEAGRLLRVVNALGILFVRANTSKVLTHEEFYLWWWLSFPPRRTLRNDNMNVVRGWGQNFGGTQTCSKSIYYSIASSSCVAAFNQQSIGIASHINTTGTTTKIPQNCQQLN